MCVRVGVRASAQRGQWRAYDPLELELQMVVSSPAYTLHKCWELNAVSDSFACLAIFLALNMMIFILKDDCLFEFNRSSYVGSFRQHTKKGRKWKVFQLNVGVTVKRTAAKGCKLTDIFQIK